MSSIVSLLLLALGLSACVAAEDRAIQAHTQALEAAAPTQAAALVFGDAQYAELSRDSPTYNFDFELAGPAAVSLRTSSVPDEQPVETRLELYELDQRRPRLLVSSSECAGTGMTASQLSYDADAGSYRAVVRGAHTRSRGPFVLTATCAGPGCPSTSSGAEGGTCLFGSVFSDIRSNARLRLSSETWLRSTAELTPLDAEQLVRAVQQSSHTDVTTAAEALARVDQQEIRLVELVEIASGREFRAFEYGVGDNSYGAFFERSSAQVVASIHDGDLLDCRITAADADAT